MFCRKKGENTLEFYRQAGTKGADLVIEGDELYYNETSSSPPCFIRHFLNRQISLTLQCVGGYQFSSMNRKFNFFYYKMLCMIQFSAINKLKAGTVQGKASFTALQKLINIQYIRRSSLLAIQKKAQKSNKPTKYKEAMLKYE